MKYFEVSNPLMTLTLYHLQIFLFLIYIIKNWHDLVRFKSGGKKVVTQFPFEALGWVLGDLRNCEIMNKRVEEG